jgi:hypothetical protein
MACGPGVVMGSFPAGNEKRKRKGYAALSSITLLSSIKELRPPLLRLIRFLEGKWKSMNIIGAGEHGPAVERVETWNEGGRNDAVRPSAPEQNGLEPNVLGPHLAERE